MVICDRFIFLHLQKCAGTFVREFLMKAFDNVEHRGSHNALKKKPVDKFVFGTIRNPFDWYVSWYSKRIKDTQEGKMFYELFGHQPTFKEFMFDIMTRGDKKIHDVDFRETNQQDIGVFTYRYNQVFKCEPDYVCRVETLYDDLIECFETFNMPLNKEQKKILYSLPVSNFSDRGRWENYYDRELMDLVMHKDKKIIDKYGYA